MADWLREFFESEFAKNYFIALLVIGILLIVVTAFSTYYLTIFIKGIDRRRYKDLSAKYKALDAEYARVKQAYDLMMEESREAQAMSIIDAVLSDDHEIEPAFRQFIDK